MTRTRRILFWSCATAAMVIAVIWVVSFVWDVGYFGVGGDAGVYLGSITLGYYRSVGGGFQIAPITALERKVFRFEWLPSSHTDGWTGDRRLFFPLWLLEVPLLAALLFVLWRCRRRGADECVRCGYSLVGNVSGVCPECGESA
jgi:hypothetical protein